MNEKIIAGQDMFAVTGMDTEATVKKILEHALITRPKKDVYARKYQPCPFMYFVKTLGAQRLDLNILYPDALPGEGVFVDFDIDCGGTEEVYLNVSEHVQAWYNGVKLSAGESGTDGMMHLPIRVCEKERNAVRILCVKKEDGSFGFDFLLSVKRYPSMWANDYLFRMKNIFPIAEREGEEGVAVSGLMTEKVYAQLTEAEVSYVWPDAVSEEETFDFHKLCSKGNVCYVYTEAKETHRLEYHGTVSQVFIKKDKTNSWELTAQKADFLDVEKGDKLLLACTKEEGIWNLRLDTQHLYLPILKTSQEKGTKAVFTGPFYGDKCHAPEKDWDFSKVFVNEAGESCYWSFCDGSELRLYLDSVFFGQWFYALMVGFYGIRDAAILLKDREHQLLFQDNMSMLAKYFDYVEYDIKKHVMPAFMPRLYEMDVLDNIGTMGMNLIDAYLDSNDRAILPVIERIRYQAEETIPRFEDGTYYRTTTMWADDLYMSVPFLVRMGRLTGDKSWYEKAAAQLHGFKERLYMEDEHLFSHIFFPETGLPNRVPWGRGNGWVMWTLSEFLTYAEDSIDVKEQKKLFYDMAHALKRLQGEDGLWRQVLNRTEEGSYRETSCTGMFLLAFTRGVKHGWLEKDFLPTMEKAWKGLLTYSVDRTGNVYGVCMGSGCAMEAEYYYTIPTIINDDHGTGVVLAAGAEYGALRKELIE